jgi:hypothetical protein
MVHRSENESLRPSLHPCDTSAQPCSTPSFRERQQSAEPTVKHQPVEPLVNGVPNLGNHIHARPCCTDHRPSPHLRGDGQQVPLAGHSLELMAPRSSNPSPEPITRSRSVLDTNTSFGPARALTRAPMCTPCRQYRRRGPRTRRCAILRAPGCRAPVPNRELPWRSGLLAEGRRTSPGSRRRGCNAFIPKTEGLDSIGVVNLARAATLATISGCCRKTCARPLDHGVAFELGEGRHDATVSLPRSLLGMNWASLSSGRYIKFGSVSATDRGDGVITGELKNKVDRVWDAFWSDGISNQVTNIRRLGL